MPKLVPQIVHNSALLTSTAPILSKSCPFVTVYFNLLLKIRKFVFRHTGTEKNPYCCPLCPDRTVFPGDLACAPGGVQEVVFCDFFVDFSRQVWYAIGGEVGFDKTINVGKG